jgi:FemAB-related protein (PEP-CTERM system-associated)
MSAMRAYADERRAAWDAYVDAHAHGTLFHLTGWKQAVERTFGHEALYFYLERDGRIAGVLPLFAVSTLKGRALVSVPYAVYGGILADDAAAEAELLASVQTLAAERHVKYVEMRTRDANSLQLPENDLYVTFIRDLPDDPDECLGLIPRKSRASVRNGRTKFNIRSEFSDDYAPLFELYALNVRRLGSPVIPWRFLTELRNAYAGHIDVQNTLFEGHVIAAVLNFYYKDAIVPYYSGCDENYFFTQCNNVMYCDLMESAVKRGFKRFDFGRSRREAGPYQFKVNMGFTPQPLHYQYVLLGLKELPRINPSNPKFALPRRIWSHLPLGVTKIVGPQLLKYIP